MAYLSAYILAIATDGIARFDNKQGALNSKSALDAPKCWVEL